MIYDRVRRRRPDIGLATVYRNLNDLVSADRIQRLTPGNGEVRYDGKGKSHCHIVCKTCGKIIDLTDCEGIKVHSKKLESMKFRLDPSDAEIFTICPTCNAR